MQLRIRPVLIVFVCALPLSCGVISLPQATSDELNRGLVVLYPGGSSEPLELIFWYAGLREAGVDQAIEIIAWGVPGDAVRNATDYEAVKASAGREAVRLKQYIDAYPDCPVTLVGYSAGAAIAALSAAALPSGYAVDRVILMSADLAPTFDLSPTLDHTRLGAMYYWSPYDFQSPAATISAGTVDRAFVAPAASEGFAMQDPRLTAVEWKPDMIVYGNFGGHLDYLFNAPFVRDFLAPWIVGAHDTQK